MNPFDKMLTSIINIEKPDGKQFNNIKAKISSENILIHDVKLPIKNGDIISRKLPNGNIEKFEIIDFNYHEGLKKIPPSFRIQYKKL